MTNKTPAEKMNDFNEALRNVADAIFPVPDPTPAEVEMEDPERFRIYRLCEGELELVATCGTKEAVGVALVTLASEGEFEKCPVGLMDRPAGKETGTWLIRPWLPFPTPKNLSDAGRVLRTARTA